MLTISNDYKISRNAFDLHQQALDIYQNTYGNDHPIVAKVSKIHLNCYGNIITAIVANRLGNHAPKKILVHSILLFQILK